MEVVAAKSSASCHGKPTRFFETDAPAFFVKKGTYDTAAKIPASVDVEAEGAGEPEEPACGEEKGFIGLGEATPLGLTVATIAPVLDLCALELAEEVPLKEAAVA